MSGSPELSRVPPPPYFPSSGGPGYPPQPRDPGGPGAPFAGWNGAAPNGAPALGYYAPPTAPQKTPSVVFPPTMPLRQNPVFLREITPLGPFLLRVKHFTYLCALASVLLLGAFATMTAVTLKGALVSGPPPVEALGMILKTVLGSWFMFPLAWITGWLHFRNRLKSGFYEQIYFTQLDAREVLRGQVTALLLPPIAFFAIAAIVVACCELITLYLGGIRSNGPYMIGQVVQGCVFVLGGALAFCGGIFAGTRWAFASHVKNALGEAVPQVLLAIMTMMCFGVLGVLYFSLFRDLEREFWWRSVYIPLEKSAGRSRLDESAQ